MSRNNSLKKTIEDLKSELEYSKNEYDKAVANYGEKNNQAIYLSGRINALEYAINKIEENMFDRKKWQQNYNKKYKQEHEDKIKEIKRKYRETHREQIKEYMKKRYQQKKHNDKGE